MHADEAAYRAYEDGEITLDGIAYEVIGGLEFEDRFCEILDEWFGTVKIGGFEWDTSTALKRVDPIAWREMQLQELDDMATNSRVLVYGETLEDAISNATTIGEEN